MNFIGYIRLFKPLFIPHSIIDFCKFLGVTKEIPIYAESSASGFDGC